MRKLEVAVLSIGVVNITTGATMYDWSIYDQITPNTTRIYLTSSSRLIYATDGTFEVDDHIIYRHNDTNRKLGIDTIVDSSIAVKEDLLLMLKKHRFDYYPIKAFKARAKDNRKLQTSYSCKGILTIS